MTKRYKVGTIGYVEDFRVDTFLEAIGEVYKTYGLSLGHEDERGEFIVENLSEANVSWLAEASIAQDVEPCAVDIGGEGVSTPEGAEGAAVAAATHAS